MDWLGSSAKAEERCNGATARSSSGGGDQK